MYSWEIERLLKIRNYLITYTEYFEILSTSSQINHIKYTPEDDKTMIETTDNYQFKFKVYRKER